MSTILLENTVVLRSDKGVTTYKLDEYVRWHCLLEAIAHIEYKAKEIGVNLDKDPNWIQPLALQKYIRERFISMKYEIVSALNGNPDTIKVP